MLVKITTDIAEALLAEAQRTAVREGTTLPALVEEGLRRVLFDGGRSAAFRLRDASFGGNGLRPEWRAKSWQQIREELAADPRGSL
jgi:hypothetical protein